MRIISGIRRGHTIRGPGNNRATRPTSDLVREAIFNLIGTEVEGRSAIDLFAGTGALGLEALSRGAASAIFVERRGQNAALIRRNLAQLRFEGMAEVVTANVYSWVSNVEFPPDAGPVTVFLDPPYREYVENPGKINTLLSSLCERLPQESVIVAESGGDPGPFALPEPDRWLLRHYGDTTIAIRFLDHAE